MKLSALTRTRKCLDFNEIRILFKGFFESQLDTALLRGCFIAELQTTEKIIYTKEFLGWYMMIRNQLLRNS